MLLYALPVLSLLVNFCLAANSSQGYESPKEHGGQLVTVRLWSNLESQ